MHKKTGYLLFRCAFALKLRFFFRCMFSLLLRFLEMFADG